MRWLSCAIHVHGVFMHGYHKTAMDTVPTGITVYAGSQCISYQEQVHVHVLGVLFTHNVLTVRSP